MRVEKMRGKINHVLIFLLLISSLSYQTAAFNVNNSVNSKKIFFLNDFAIYKEIDETEGKVLVIEKTIGDYQVNYWEHFIDGVRIINDSILLQIDLFSEKIVKYKKSWVDNINILKNPIRDIFECSNIVEKQLVFFPERTDCGHFYTFLKTQDFPIFCWEVWNNNGETLLYDFSGKTIGFGVPTPNSGFSLSGYDYNPRYPDDPWIGYRINADSYFQEWCSSSTSISLPDKEELSFHVRDSSTDFFYEIAHGDHTHFLINDNWEHYYFSTARKDMENRPPMKFAFIGSCKGMNNVSLNSFSYQFRKGEMYKTVTVGYCNMTQSAWKYSFMWQDHMFKLMDEKIPIYEAFMQACAEYPCISENVVFVGDEKLTVESKPRVLASDCSSKPLMSLTKDILELFDSNLLFLYKLNISL